MNKLGIIGAILASAVIMGGSGGAVMAADETPTPVAVAQAEQQYQGVVGVVSADSDIAGGIIQLETKNLGDVKVILDDTTTYDVPGQDSASRDDIVSGARLAIQATANEDGSYNAVRVMVVPDKATRQHLNGVVVSVQNRIMTVMNAAGETMTVELPEGVKGGVVGDFIATCAQKSAGKETPVASGTQTAAEVQTRLQTQLNAVAGQQADTQAEVQTREQIMAQLSAKLEGLGLKNKGELEQVMAKVPEAAKAGIQVAIGNCEQRMEQARQAIQNANAVAGNQQSTQTATATGSQSATPGGQGR